MTRPFLPAALAVCIALTAKLPANAQNSFEFGYKDRLFQQEYVLPDEMSQSEVKQYAQAMMTLGLLNPEFAKIGGDQAAIRKRLGGECGQRFLSGLAPTNLTTAQQRIEAMPAPHQTENYVIRTPCDLQVLVYLAATMDAASTSRQLEGLRISIQERYHDDWVMAAQATDPVFIQSARKLAALWSRANRLTSKGVLAAGKISGELEAGPLTARVAKFSDAATYAAIDARLTALEEQAPELIQREQAEAAVRQKEAARNAYREELIAGANGDVARVKQALEIELSNYENAKMRAELNPDPTGELTRNLEINREEIARIEGDLKKAIAARERLFAHLAKLDAQGGSVDPTPQPQVSSEAALSEISICRPGTRCSTTEKVVFCSGLEALQAVLARPAGNERRALLRALMGRGDCAILDVGTELATRGPVRRVTPIGEAPVEAVAATLETGRKGFVLLSGLSAAQTASR